MLAKRIRMDKVVTDQRKYDMEKTLEHIHKQSNIYDKEETGVIE